MRPLSFQRLAVVCLAMAACTMTHAAEVDKPAAKTDDRYPFRTDFANLHLPWYQIKPLEFPPHHSDHRVSGELVEADFIHRTGQFRRNDTGELVNFTLPPYGYISYLNAEASLADLPLETRFLFFLHQDKDGAFTRLATMQEDYTMLASHEFTYRLDEVKLAEGKLLVAKHSVPKNKPDLGKRELLVSDQTQVWKGGKVAKLADLQPGDELLINTRGNTGKAPNSVAQIWAGTDMHEAATKEQQARHHAYLRQRGIPAWIEQVENRDLTVSFLGDAKSLKALFEADGIDPGKWVKERRSFYMCVANGDLRTYNPAVDKQVTVVERIVPPVADGYGNSKQRWVIRPNMMLEGMRKGRLVRVFLHQSWEVKDMPFGEGVYTEVPAEETRDPSANQFPFRTNFANEDQPWYRLQENIFPPARSENRIQGELLEVNAAERSGKFRQDTTGEIQSFRLLPYGSVHRANTQAQLEDIPVGTRCRFYLHPDEQGRFTQASIIMDEYSYMAANKVDYQILSINQKEGTLVAARQLAEVKNYNGDMVKPPDIGRTLLAFTEQTKVWKNGKPAKVADLAVGDTFLMNQSGIGKKDRGLCTEIWVGAESQETLTTEQRRKYQHTLKTQGMPGWIEKVEGNRMMVIFFSGRRDEFKAMIGSDPRNLPLRVTQVDAALRPTSAKVENIKWGHNEAESEITFGVYGCAGVRWGMVASQPIPAEFKPGQIVRVIRSDWAGIPAKVTP